MDSALKHFLSDPDLRRHIISKEHRDVDNPDSYYGSQAFKDLDAALGGALTSTDPDMKVVEVSIGGDGVQLLNWGTRTATLIVLKCESLPTSLVQTGVACVPLLVIEGKHEPKVLQHVLKPIVDFLCDHAPVTGVPLEFSEPHPLVLEEDRTEEELRVAESVAYRAKLEAAMDPESRSRRTACADAVRLAAEAKVVHDAAVDAVKVHERAGGSRTVVSKWYVVLRSLFGDSPFACKLRCSTAPTSCSACPRCLLLGAKKAPDDEGNPVGPPLKSTAFGGCSRPAQHQQVQYEADPENPDDVEFAGLGEVPEFTYACGQGPRAGTFDREAAMSIEIDEAYDRWFQDLAEQIAGEHRENFKAELKAELEKRNNNRAHPDFPRGAIKLVCLLLGMLIYTHPCSVNFIASRNLWWSVKSYQWRPCTLLFSLAPGKATCLW